MKKNKHPIRCRMVSLSTPRRIIDRTIDGDGLTALAVARKAMIYRKVSINDIENFRESTMILVDYIDGSLHQFNYNDLI